METLIIGLAINLYTWSNADFFVHRKNNERQYKCVWVDKGWSKADKENPSITILGYTKYKHHCIVKEK
tara:strand:- start:96 stop:299 length:204 start_codon:yes stop_codon:yes gene_type:complete